MGTKANPGKYDCHAKAEPDEPLFTLLGRDPMAGHLVSIWSKLRQGDIEAAQTVFMHLIGRVDATLGYPRDYEPDVEKGQEAMNCSLAMFKWRKKMESAK